MAFRCGSVVYVSWVFLSAWSSLSYQIPSGAGIMSDWNATIRKRRTRSMSFSQSGGFHQVSIGMSQRCGRVLILFRSDLGWTPCHNRALHLCLDALPGRTLDCTDHWQCLIWRRVSLLDTCPDQICIDADGLWRLGLSWSTRASSHSWLMRIRFGQPVPWQRIALLGQDLEECFLCLEFRVSLS